MRKLVVQILLPTMALASFLVVTSRCTLAFSNSHRMSTYRSKATQLSTRSIPNASATRCRSTLSDPSTELILPDNVQTWLDIRLPEGRCVGVSILEDDDTFGKLSSPEILSSRPDHWMHGAFHPEELAYGMTLSEATASSFWLGRLAMRIALDFPSYPILKDSYGRPQLQGHVCGSISHKDHCGVALISQSLTTNSKVMGVGVDLELTSRPGKRSIASRILTERERNSLGSLPGVSVDEEVLLRFSLKEAIYKAAHPLLCQYVGFQEAEVTPHDGGTATCTWHLESGADTSLANLKAHWRRLDDRGFFLTSASVELAT